MRHFTLISVFLLAFLLFGCTGNPVSAKLNVTVSNETAVPPSTQEMLCPSYPSTSPVRDDCLLGTALLQNESSPCLSISSPSLKDDCFFGIALQKKDASLCNRLISREAKQYCLIDVSSSEGSGTPCDREKPEKRSSCFFELALSGNETAHCGRIANASLKDDCFLVLSISRNDALGCAKILAGGPRDECYFSVATAMSYPDTCERIESPKRADCLLQVAKQKDDFNLCSRISSGSGTRSDCYYYFAVSKKMPALCDFVTDAEVRGICYSDFARMDRNTTYCLKISPEKTIERDQCASNVAFALKNQTLCYNLITPQIRDSCLSNFAALWG